MSVIFAYSSAKPQSGYTSAVTGYACKLANALNYKAVMLSSQTEASVLAMAAQEGLPAIAIGLTDIPSHWSCFVLKARPYADQHGDGPSMHALMPEAIPSVTVDPHCATIVLANPAWLVTDSVINSLNQWCAQHAVTRLNLSASPRTNPLLWEEVIECWPQQLEVPVTCNPWHPAQCGENQYLNMLAEASWQLLLGTSRSMAAEMAMFAAPIILRGDDKAQDARFFAATQAHAALHTRYHAFDADHTVPHISHTPYDVTSDYVAEAVKLYRQWQQEAA